jgi:hypothetical protein
LTSRSIRARQSGRVVSSPCRNRTYERAGFNGQFADAHNFIQSALSAAPVAAVARRDRFAADEKLAALGGWLLLVDDAIAALQTSGSKSLRAVGATGYRHHGQCREDYDERTDRACASLRRSSRAQE